MADNDREPRNPFYILLIAVGFAFVITALAYAVVPVLEQKAREAGSPPPPSPLRDSLRSDGWIWLLVEAGLVAVLSLASMGYDRWLRTLKKRPGQEKIATGEPLDAVGNPQPPSSSS
jgi:uncharacterized membrane protein